MVKKNENVDGKPQEEVARKTVRKPRQTRKKAEKPAEEQTKKEETPIADEPEAKPKAKRSPQSKKEKAEKPQAEVTTVQPEQAENEPKAKTDEAPAAPAPAPQPKPAEQPAKPEPKAIPPLPNIVINDIMELANAPKAQICLSDQVIQQLTLAEANHRFQYLEYTLANILDYDIVISDTNIWLELLVGHTSSHSDPRVNARLQFERQLEYISKYAKYRGGKFMMMSETYEEIDRFATAQEPTNYREADWTDEALCRNVAARLAKRLILSQQRENRLRIEGVCAESHHGAFADPAIIRRTVEMFASGKKVLLLTNDASVAIRSLGMCDDLQRWNKIDDKVWDKVYAPLRPMVFTMDDLKVLDNYTRQYHFLQMAAGAQWMQDIPKIPASRHDNETWKPLELWIDGFRPGDRHERHSDIQARQKEQQKKLENERQQQEEQRRKAEEQKRLKEEQRRLQSERDKARQAEINRLKAEAEAQQRAEAEKKAEQQRIEAEKKAEQQRIEAEEKAEKQRLEDEKKAEQQRIEAEKKPKQQHLDAEKKAEVKQKAERVAKKLQEKAEAKAMKQDAEKPAPEQQDAPKEETAKKKPVRRGHVTRTRKPAQKKEEQQ